MVKLTRTFANEEIAYILDCKTADDTTEYARICNIEHFIQQEEHLSKSGEHFRHKSCE